MTPAAHIQTAAEAALIALCALTACLIAADPAIRVRRGRILAAPFALFALATAGQMADSFRLYAAAPALAAAVYGAVALIPAAVFAAVRRLARPQAPRPSRLHLAPALAVTLGLGALFAAEGLAAPGAMLAKRGFWVLFTLAGAGYVVAAALEIRLGARRLRDLVSFRGGTAERGLDFAVLMLALPLMALAVELLAVELPAGVGAGAGAPVGDGARLGLGLFRMGCIGLLAALALRPRAFLAPDGAGPVDTAPESGGGRDGAGYARSGLDPAAAARIAAKLQQAMRAHRLHRDPFLTREALAARVGAPPQRVSQVLNQTLGVSFFDFVNAHRVAEARGLLATEPERPIAEIAAAVGFNSRSTFHAAFRKHADATPSAWRDRSAPAPPAPRADPAR